MNSKATALLPALVLALIATPHLKAADPDVQVLLGGVPAAVGTYTFPFANPTTALVLDNGLIRFSFTRDDAAGGVVTGWDGSTSDRPATVSITAASIIVNGTELAHNLNGVSPRDPDRQHSFYIDSGGGTGRLICSQVKVIRTSADLVEVAFVDTTSTPLRHEHHLIMRRGKQGLYGYNIFTKVGTGSASVGEMRMNPRWDRSIFDHAFNWERGGGQQPTYAYLATQTSVGDETWRINGANNAGLPANTVYTKYNWSLYHHENPMFGHYGHGFGAWFTPLSGVSDQTLAGFYGVGPNHQDLAIHQDALILNYFHPNHYGLPAYSYASGYKRLFGPWFTYVTAGDPNDPDSMIAAARVVAENEIAENRAGSSWISDPLYPTPAQRTTVTGHLQIADGRPADGYWVLLSVQNVTDVYTIHEPTYYVKTNANGDFSIPGVPPPLAAGTTTPSSYVLYIWGSKGSVVDQFKQTGITFSGPVKDLGTINWAPTNRTTFLWQIGKYDRNGGEFALATDPSTWANPRSYEKPTQVPGSLTYDIGSSWEPLNWYYAQTNGGTWSIRFNLPRTYTGTAFFTVSSSLQSGSAPTVTVNGTGGLTGSVPSNNDSTIARQADRSGYPRQSTISFAATRLVAGLNTINLTRGNGAAGGNGLGYDTLLLEVNETAAPPPAQLTASLASITGPKSATVWKIHVTNPGTGPSNDTRLDSLALSQSAGGAGGEPVILGRDPNRFPTPLGSIPAGGSVDYNVTLDLSSLADDARLDAVLPFSGNGGRVRTTLNVSNQYPFTDTISPVVNWTVATPNSLGVVDNLPHTVTVSVDATDNADPAPVSRIVAVTSNQDPIDPSDVSPAVLPDPANPLVVQLRAKTSTPGSSRVYTIQVETKDYSGNITYSTVNVSASPLPGRPR